MQEGTNHFKELGNFGSEAFNGALLCFENLQLCYNKISFGSHHISQFVECIHSLIVCDLLLCYCCINEKLGVCSTSHLSYLMMVGEFFGPV